METEDGRYSCQHRSQDFPLTLLFVHLHRRLQTASLKNKTRKLHKRQPSMETNNATFKLHGNWLRRGTARKTRNYPSKAKQWAPLQSIKDVTGQDAPVEASCVYCFHKRFCRRGSFYALRCARCLVSVGVALGLYMARLWKESRSKEKVALFVSIEGLPRKQNKKKRR